MSVKVIKSYEFKCELCEIKLTCSQEVAPAGWVTLPRTVSSEEFHVCKTCTVSFFKKAAEMFDFSKWLDASFESRYPTRQADPHA